MLGVMIKYDRNILLCVCVPHPSSGKEFLGQMLPGSVSLDGTENTGEPQCLCVSHLSDKTVLVKRFS